MLPSKPTGDQAIALAAVFQCCQLVHQLAHEGNASNMDMELCMRALLNQNPASVQELYGSPANLSKGSQAMRKILDKERSPELQQILQYSLAILHLERRLRKNTKMMDEIATGIKQAGRQAEHFAPTHENVYSNLASLYQSTLSTFNFRIQVRGNPDYLNQKAVASKIRCLLFAAVRSAYLWRQLGGKRYHLVVFNKRIASLLPR